jgi:hypothetical protein
MMLVLRISLPWNSLFYGIKRKIILLILYSTGILVDDAILPVDISLMNPTHNALLAAYREMGLRKIPRE